MKPAYELPAYELQPSYDDSATLLLARRVSVPAAQKCRMFAKLSGSQRGGSGDPPRKSL
jgi:hypothetical protein